MITIEYFSNNVWHKTKSSYSELVKLFGHLTYRITYQYNHYWKQIYYIIDEPFLPSARRHRLDGPAYFHRDSSILVVEQFWHVHGKHLLDFEKYLHSVESIFQYVKTYPQFINEIIIIAEHNHWLTEDQILLLKTTSLLSAENK